MQADAFAANQKNFEIGARFLDVDTDGNPLQSSVPESWTDVYNREQAAKQMQLPDVPEFDGKSPSMGKINLDAMTRGIFNNSFMMNNAHLGSEMDRFDAKSRSFNMASTRREQQLAQQDRELSRAERLRTDRVRHFTDATNSYQDPQMLASLGATSALARPRGFRPVRLAAAVVAVACRARSAVPAIRCRCSRTRESTMAWIVAASLLPAFRAIRRR